MRRLNQPGAIDLFESLWRQLRDDQLAAIVVDEEAVAVPDKKRRAVHRAFFEERVRPPYQLACGGVETAKLAVVVHAVHVVILQHRRADDGVEGIGRVVGHPGILLAWSLPKKRRRRPLIVEP